MYYLDHIHQLSHDCHLTDEELSILRNTIDSMVWNRIHELPNADESDELTAVLKKIKDAGKLDALKALLRRDVDFDDTDLDDDVAGVH